MGASSSLSIGKGELCSQGHRHHNKDDAWACEQYYSKRLKENDQLKQMDYMLGNNTRQRGFHPYSQGSGSNSTPQRRMMLKEPDTREFDEARDTVSGNVTITELPPDEGDNRINSRKERNGVHTSCKQPGNVEQPKQGAKGEDKQEDVQAKKGFTLFEHFRSKIGNGYNCAAHHSHKTQTEADACTQAQEKKSRLKHEEIMQAKLDRGRENGLDPKLTKPSAPYQEMKSNPDEGTEVD